MTAPSKVPGELLKEVESVAHGEKHVLHHSNHDTKSVTNLLSEVRHVHGNADVLRKSVGPVDKQALLQEVRKDAGKKEVLHHSKVGTKSTSALLTEVRLNHDKVELKHAKTVDKQSLLKDVRKSASGRNLVTE